MGEIEEDRADVARDALWRGRPSLPSSDDDKNQLEAVEGIAYSLVLSLAAWAVILIAAKLIV